MISVRMTHDTAHYDECRTIMHKHRRTHMTRFFILFVLCMFNGYMHIVPMPMLRADGVFARNAIFTSGFAYALLAFLFTIALLVIGFLGTQERPVLIRIAILLLAVGLLFGLMNIFCLIACFVLFAIALHESKKALWVTQQPGYPYFNERFYEQMEQYSQDYESEHADMQPMQDDMARLEDATDRNSLMTGQRNMKFTGSMPDAEPLPPPAPKKKAKTTARRKADPSIIPVQEFKKASPIAPAPQEAAPIQTPVFTKEADILPASAEEIPAPVWDIPDPVMDTSAVVSDFPDVSGDIPDLPDIPDIPKL